VEKEFGTLRFCREKIVLKEFTSFTIILGMLLVIVFW